MALQKMRDIKPVYLAASVGIFLTFVFVTLISTHHSVHIKSSIRDHLRNINIPLGPSSSPSIYSSRVASISFEGALRTLYAPLLASIDSPNFVDPTDGQEYHLPDGEPAWRKPLGKELCIVDIDTRPLNESNQIMSEEFNWQNIEGVSVGMLNHYLYALIHGYDYKFIHTSQWFNNSRDDVWTKIPALRETLQDYRFVVMIDADAVFRNLHLPYEWLLNRWDITEDTSLAMPLDPEWYEDSHTPLGYTKNKYGDLNPNAGFVTAQNLPRTFEILDAWISCPDNEERYPGCDHFRKGWPAEQGAFGEHIRYEFNKTTDFKAFSCTDGNGFPSQNSECKGIFVRHFTTGKGELKAAVGDTLLHTLFARTHGDIMRRWGDVVIERNSTEGLDEAYL